MELLDRPEVEMVLHTQSHREWVLPEEIQLGRAVHYASEQGDLRPALQRLSREVGREWLGTDSELGDRG